MLRNLSLSLLTFALMIGIASAESSKPGLMILSHGSPSPAWTEAFVDFTKKVETLNAEKKVFHAVIGVNMEFTLPDAVAGIKTLEAAGCDRIIVVPVFVSPTSHTHFDVPAVLGLYSSPSMRETWKGHGQIAAPKVPVTVTQTMDEGDLLDWFIEDEVRALSKNPKDEAVLLIAHGDKTHAWIVDKIMSRLFAKACGSAGITSGQIAYCEVGQSYTKNVIPAIIELSENKTKSVLVIGVYLAISPKTLHERAGKMGTPTEHTHAGHAPAEDSHAGHSHAGHAHGPVDGNPLDGIDIRLSDKGVIDHPKMPQWVLDTASEAL